jgi:hypothetical protein
MNQQFGPLLYTISVWALPAIVAITFHEAAHGFAARLLGGGRIAVGLLPNALSSPLARLEPYVLIILIGLLFILPIAAR